MTIYEARLANAQRIYKLLKGYLDRGCILMDNEGMEVTNVHFENGLFYTIGHANSIEFYFENNRDMDHGLYTPIREFNKHFLGWKVYKDVIILNEKILGGKV